MLGIALLLTGLWIAASGWRHDMANGYDAKAEQQLGSKKYPDAYQQERYAYALAATDQRRVTLGSLAYLRQDYGAALNYFAQVDTKSTHAEKARIGGLLSAAAKGDRKRYEDYKKNSADSETFKVALAQAALDIGDMDGLSRACACSSKSRVMAYLAAVGQAVENPASSKAALVATTELDVESENNPKAYTQMLQEALELDTKDYQALGLALEKMAGVTSPASRQTYLAGVLYRRGEYRATAALASDALKVDPKYRDAWNLLAAAQISQRQFKDADGSLRTSLSLDPAYGQTWQLKAELAAGRGNADEAEDFKKKAAALGYKES